MSKKTVLIWLVLALVVLLPRVFDLDAFETADEKRWLSNTVGFVTNLAHGEWGYLMQQPHPGITTQWLASPTVFSNSWTVRKLPLVIGQSILVLFIGYVFWRLTTSKLTAGLVVLLLSINPPLIAHTRVYAMDSLLSHFLILAIALLFLWRRSRSWHYLALSAFAAAGAVLSKISGVIIIPFVLGLIVIWIFKDKKEGSGTHATFNSLLSWLAFFMFGLVLILPSLAFNTKEVISDILIWLKSDDYLLHKIGPLYYLRTLVFFSTPLHWFALLTAPVLLVSRKIPRQLRILLIVFLLFAILFTVQMSLGSKKGDRYILPVFLYLDIIAALIISFVISLKGRSNALLVIRVSVIGLLVLQSISLLSLHPYYLSYVNPITQPFFGERRLGWGEGLDLAAEYINELPNSDSLTVASYYPKEFANNFNGNTVPAHEHDHVNVDYVVIYRAMFERGESAWETDVLNVYRKLTPIKTISINATPMAWIYRIEK